MKKRTKQTQELVNLVNDYFRFNFIDDESNEVFQVVTWALLKMQVYQGFNHFRHTKCNRESVLVLDSENHDCLQLY